MAINNLQDMFEHELKEMYYIENRLVDVLDELANEASNDKLRQGFEEHREETREQVQRLERAFDSMGMEPEQGKSRVLDAMVEEHEEFTQQAEDGQLRDLFDTQAGMKTERMEITAYEGMITLAKKLNMDDEVTDALEDNLSEEKSTLRELESLSKGSKLKSMIGQLAD